MIGLRGLFIVILIILFLLKLSHKKDKNSIKGEIGERLVKNELSKLSSKYRIINDVILETNRGTSQIDHIVIGKKGIYVIETKNFSGVIYGKNEDVYWVQILGNQRNKFYNPMKQNFGHIKAIKQILNFSEELNYFSLVVFCNKIKLRGVNETKNVIYLRQLIKTIKKTKAKNVINMNQIIYIDNKIKKYNLSNDKKIKQKHIKSIKNISR